MPDLIDSLVGPTVAALRARRPDFVRHTQGYHDVLLRPAEPGGLSPAERALIALRVAELAGHRALAAHYRGLLASYPSPAETPRLRTILAHVERVATAPGASSKADLARLHEAGLAVGDIVTLSHIVAFVSYQVRIAAGLALLAAEPRP